MDFFSIFLPNIAYADFNSFLNNFSTVIINPLIRLLFALGIAYFLYGVFVFLTNADNETERTAGKNHMLYGIVGLTIMMGVWGILNLVLNTLNITGINPEAGTVQLNTYNPTLPSTPSTPSTSGTGSSGTSGSGFGGGSGSSGTTVPNTGTGTTTPVNNTPSDPVINNNPTLSPVNDNLDPVGPSGFDPVINTNPSGTTPLSPNTNTNSNSNIDFN
jgi:hypothetical protein